MAGGGGGGGRQRLAGGDAELPLDQVEAGDELGDGVFDLEAGVHLHEEEVVAWAVIGAACRGDDELDGAGADVTDCAGGLDGGLAHGGAAVRGHAGGGGLLHHFLVAALDGAVALEQADGVAGLVGEDLDLDVAGARQVALDQHLVVTERGRGLALGQGQGFGEVGWGGDDAHALAATAGAGLDQHGIADAIGLRGQVGGVLVGAVVAGDEGDAGLLHQGLGGGLAAHGADGRGGGADEHEAGLRAGLGEVGVLGQEAVSGVDGLGAGLVRGGDDPLLVQVGVARRRRADRDCDVGHRGVQRALVGLGVDGDGADAHATGGADDAAGDLAAVGDQDGVEHHCFPELCGRRPVTSETVRTRHARRSRARWGR